MPTLPNRLRQAAQYTGLDGLRELLIEAAGALEQLKADFDSAVAQRGAAFRRIEELGRSGFHETHPSLIRFGGRCEKHLQAKPCQMCATQPEREMVIACRCFDDATRRFCRDKNDCSRIEAQRTGS